MKKLLITVTIFLSLYDGAFFKPVTEKLKIHRFADEEYDKIEKDNAKNGHDQNNHGSAPSSVDLDLEYNHYLNEVVRTLESDAEFKKKLEAANEADIRSAKIAEELDYVSHHVRSKLDELKRVELDRLLRLAKKANHLDRTNPETFEVIDLKKLIHNTAKDLEEQDKKREAMFKEYEMQKHFEREQRLKAMSDDEKKKFLEEERLNEVKRKEIREKEKIHHPGSKKQLEEVWEEQDHMDKEDFNPKTFFAIHDVDGNGYLDEDEVKALFFQELDKLYKQGIPQADLMERAEEMERMRQHVFKEVDTNKDRLISWEEFYVMSMKPDFQQDPGWKPLDEQQIYSEEELQRYEQQRQAEVDHLIEQGRYSQYPPEYEGYAHQEPPQHLDNNPPLQYANQYSYKDHIDQSLDHKRDQYHPVNQANIQYHPPPVVQNTQQHHQPPVNHASQQYHQPPANHANQQYHQSPGDQVNQQYHQPPVNHASQQYHQPPANHANQQYHQSPGDQVNQQYHLPPVDQANNQYHQPPVGQVNQQYHLPPGDQANKQYHHVPVDQGNQQYHPPQGGQVNQQHHLPPVDQANKQYHQPPVDQGNQQYHPPQGDQVNQQHHHLPVDQVNQQYHPPPVDQGDAQHHLPEQHEPEEHEPEEHDDPEHHEHIIEWQGSVLRTKKVRKI